MDVYWYQSGVTSYIQRRERNSTNKFEIWSKWRQYFRWKRFKQTATFYTSMRKTDFTMEMTWERHNIRTYSIINLPLLNSHTFLFFPPQRPSRSLAPHNPSFSLAYFAGESPVVFVAGHKEQGLSELYGALCTWRQFTTRPVPGVDNIREH